MLFDTSFLYEYILKNLVLHFYSSYVLKFGLFFQEVLLSSPLLVGT